MDATSTCIPTCDSVNHSKTLAVTGKNGQLDKDRAQVVRKPLDGGNELYFVGYAHDVFVHHLEKEMYIKLTCWASPEKTTKYVQKLLLVETNTNSADKSAEVWFARCEGSVAGGDHQMLAVCNVEWADFLAWIGSKDSMSVERIHFDAEFWANLLPKLQEFYWNHGIPNVRARHRPVAPSEEMSAVPVAPADDWSVMGSSCNRTFASR